MLSCAVFTVGCSSDTFDPPDIDCEGTDCELEKKGTDSESSTTSVSSGGGIAPTNVSNPISVGSTSTTSGVGGFADSSKKQVGGGSTNPNENTLQYGSSSNGYGTFFTKLNEPIDQQISEKLPFAFKFVAIGAMPLKYSWYKVTASGTQKLATTETVFAKASAKFSDAAEYYATVEDNDGNILTSRRAILKVNPERVPCAADQYGPRDYIHLSATNVNNGAYNYRSLVRRSQMTRTSGANYVSLPKEIDGYAISISQCVHYQTGGTTCVGDKTLLQCQNGIYTVASTNCYCYIDIGN